MTPSGPLEMTMTDTATTGQTVTVTDAGPSLKKLAITIPAAMVSEKISASLTTIQRSSALPGFRPGRAPLRLIEKKYGKGVKDEVKDQLIAEAYQHAIETEQLKVISDPETPGLEELELIDGKDLCFEVEVEVAPEFDLPSLDGIEVYRPLIEVEDQRIEAEAQKLCINDGELEERKTSDAGDYLTGAGVMVGDDGTEFYNIEGAVVQVPGDDSDGRGMVLGILIEDLGKQLGTPKPGETVTITATGPEQHERQEIRDQKLTITFKVDRVDRIVPAELDDIVAKFGLADADQLKGIIRDRLEQSVVVEQQTMMRRQVSKHLVESTEIELPAKMTEQQAARNLERRRLELMYQGADAAEVERHVAEMRSASTEAAQHELKLFFILNRAAEDLDVKVEESEINGQIVRMAQEQGVRPEQLRQDMISQNRIPMIAEQIREHKVMDAIIEKSEVKDATIEEFNARFGGEGESGEKAASKKVTKKTSKATTKKTTKKSASKKTTKKTSKKSGD